MLFQVLLLVIIVIGGIVAGYFTATEASAIAVSLRSHTFCIDFTKKLR